MSCGQYTESSAGRIRVVTSGTRPTGVDRYVGQRIFESDTGRELMYDGTGWVIMSEPLNAWNTSAWWTGVTGGSPSYVGDYHRSDGWCDFEITWSLGSTSAISGSLGMSLPITAASANLRHAWCQIFDADVGLRIGAVQSNSTGVVVPGYVSSTSGGFTAVNGTSPQTWTTSDSIWVAGRYRMTTRYS